MQTVSWFSAGVSSAVATKLLIGEIDRIIYTHIDDQHPDTMRFVRDCEAWFGKPVEILRAPTDVETACVTCGGKGYITGKGFTPCTKLLKREVRQRWEYEQPIDAKFRYVWGMDCDENNRIPGILESMPEQDHVFPLAERRITKRIAHEILTASKIKRPEMYDLGYLNNNCIGCLRGGMAYWNKIRVDFPEVFAKRAAMERLIGASCIKDDDGRVYLDELDPKRGRGEPPIVGDCGILCEVMSL